MEAAEKNAVIFLSIFVKSINHTLAVKTGVLHEGNSFHHNLDSCVSQHEGTENRTSFV